MKPQIFQINHIEKNDVTFSVPYQTDTQIIFPILYKNENPLFIQTPELLVNSEINNDTLNLSLSGKTEVTTQNVTNCFMSIDNKIQTELRSLIHTGRKLYPNYKWTKKFTYNAIVNIDDELPNNQSIKLFLKNTKNHEIKLYDQKHNLLNDLSYLNNHVGKFISAIIELHSVVINNENIFVYIKTHQIKISKQKIKNYHLDEYSFIESDNENSDNEAVPVPTDFTVSDYHNNNVNLEDTEIEPRCRTNSPVSSTKTFNSTAENEKKYCSKYEESNDKNTETDSDLSMDDQDSISERSYGSDMMYGQVHLDNNYPNFDQQNAYQTQTNIDYGILNQIFPEGINPLNIKIHPMGRQQTNPYMKNNF